MHPMTKFILHGGNIGIGPDEDRKRYFEEIVRGPKQPVRILLIYFAKTTDQWDAKLAEDRVFFSPEFVGCDCSVEVADPDPETFSRQAARADVLFVRGGDTLRLMEAIRPVTDFHRLLDGKTYAGSSAGAYLVSTYYYSNDRKRVEEGLGILPIKCFAHWDASQRSATDELTAYKESLPLVTLAEGAFKVFTE